MIGNKKEMLDSSKILDAAYDKDLEKLKSLITPDMKIETVRNSNRDTLLHVAVKMNSYDILDYLLNLDKISINAFNSQKETPLLLATRGPNLKLLELLIKKGANVELHDLDGSTPLHCATYYGFLENCKILLENGANVNAQNSLGYTVLHLVISVVRDVEWAAMFMCYGADMFVRSWDTCGLGYTPFEMCLTLKYVKAQNLFSDFVVNEKFPISLEALVEAMTYNCELLPYFIDNVEIIVDYDQMVIFMKAIFKCKPEYLKLFLEKYHYLLTVRNDGEFQMEVHILQVLYTYVEENEEKFTHYSSKLIKNFYIIFNEPWVSLFIDNINENLEKYPISGLFWQLKLNGINSKLIEEMILHLLSFGMDLTDKDIDEFYLLFGDGPFFRTLLHMDIIELMPFEMKQPFPTLIYSINFNIDNFYNKTLEHSSLGKILDFFVTKEIKELCFDTNNEEIIAKMRNLPNVPSLLQLARDMTRKYIVNVFSIKNSRQFYTVLENLPICDVYKSIISYEKKIY